MHPTGPGPKLYIAISFYIFLNLSKTSEAHLIEQKGFEFLETEFFPDLDFFVPLVAALIVISTSIEIVFSVKIFSRGKNFPKEK